MVDNISTLTDNRSKMILTGHYRKYRISTFHLHKVDMGILGRDHMFSFAHHVYVTGWNRHLRGGISGYGNIPVEACAISMPLAFNNSIHGLVISCNGRQLPHIVRLEHKMLKSRRSCKRADTGDAFMKPGRETALHGVGASGAAG